MAAVGKATLSNVRDVAIFGLPLVLVATLLLVAAWDMGPYGYFIPFMLVVFWLPQLVGVAFFIWCDREIHLGRTITDADADSPRE